MSEKLNMLGILNASHDLHLLVLDNRQDSMNKGMHKWHDDLIDDLHDNMEIMRNRHRIIEICHFIDYHKEEGNDLLAEVLAHGKKVSIFVPE